MAEDQNARYRARPGQEIPGESFGEAFKRHKAAGRADFSWNGQTYSTKTAQEQGREIGARAATGSGRGSFVGRKASDQDTATTQVASSGRAEIPTGGTAKAPAESGERMSPLEMGLLTTAGALAGPAIGRGAVAAYRGAKGVADTVRGAVQASRGLEEARRARLAREMDQELPALAPKERVRVEGTKGGVYRSAKDEKPAEPKAEFRSRTADRMDEREMGMKRGGAVKTYAKGGSVRGGGIEQRGKTKGRFV